MNAQAHFAQGRIEAQNRRKKQFKIKARTRNMRSFNEIEVNSFAVHQQQQQQPHRQIIKHSHII